jgi:hypothetical protein
MRRAQLVVGFDFALARAAFTFSSLLFGKKPSCHQNCGGFGLLEKQIILYRCAAKRESPENTKEDGCAVVEKMKLNETKR